MTKKEAIALGRSDGLKLRIRTRSGATIDALSSRSQSSKVDESFFESQNKIRRLAHPHIEAAIDTIGGLMKSKQPHVALAASRLLLEHSLGQNGFPGLDADRVYGSGNFDRAGIGNDRQFEANITRKDIKLLKKLGVKVRAK